MPYAATHPVRTVVDPPLVPAPAADVTWAAARLLRQLPVPNQQRILGLGGLGAIAIVVASLLAGTGPVAEVLSGAWTLPMLLALYVIDRRRAIDAIVQREQLAAARAAAARRGADANEELERALALRDSLIAVASHELRTPLTPLRGALETLDHQGQQLSERERDAVLASALRNADRLGRLVDDLLTASEARAGTLRPHPVHIGVDELLGDLADLWPEVQQPSATPTREVRADPRHVGQVLSNLASNAAKYGAPPTRVEVTDEGDAVAIAVVDAGDGVPEEFVTTLFEPFTQASTGLTRTASGVGLGLTISRTLAEASGGSLDYAPRDGECRFVLRLPPA